jgi:hypothetical protein
MGGYLIVCCEFGTDFILQQKQNLISTYYKKEGLRTVLTTLSCSINLIEVGVMDPLISSSVLINYKLPATILKTTNRTTLKKTVKCVSEVQCFEL